MTATTSLFISSSNNCSDAHHKTAGCKRTRDCYVDDEHPASSQHKQRHSADSFARVAVSSSSSGRGAVAGWTLCPLCGSHSRKLFALGRGIAAHLHAVHTPWQPGKVERQKRRRLEERQQRELRQKQRESGTDLSPSNETEDLPTRKADQTWEPSEEEVHAWNAQILQIVKELDEKHSSNAQIDVACTRPDASYPSLLAKDRMVGVDRNGMKAKTYRASLPPFIQAAADGNLPRLKEMVEQVAKNTKNYQGINQEVLNLINSRDRHLSSAEHWAAGGGQLPALKYLLNLRKQYMTSTENDSQSCTSTQNSNSNESQSKIRRRDGKTALHYAARNGRVECIKYLIQQEGYAVEEVSGDGTTAFHLACFGGHVQAIKALWHQHGADPCKCNDFDCSAAHWAGMTRCECPQTVRSMCQLLQTAGVSFVQRQKQGHTSLHKAAQRKNRQVILWLAQAKDEGGAGLSKKEKRLAGQLDDGGHSPSEIWRSVGGDDDFADWMKREMGW